MFLAPFCYSASDGVAGAGGVARQLFKIHDSSRSSSFKMWKVFSKFDSLHNLASSFTEVERGMSSFNVFLGSA